jgi:hypothetical protein
VEKIELPNRKLIDSESEVTGVFTAQTRVNNRHNNKLAYRFLIALFADFYKNRVTGLLLCCRKRLL